MWYCFYLNKNADSIFACLELERMGFNDLAVIEDPGVNEIKILAQASRENIGLHFSFASRVEKVPEEDINWKSQWELFSPNFQEGKLTFNLADYFDDGKDLYIDLHPGPGFGDLSHPSTLMTLQMMLPFIQGRIVIDVGCGSGVLGISAIKAGAQRAFAIDIDSQAINHSRENALLNNVQDEILFGLSLPEDSEVGKYPIAAMNMIATDQIQAWEGIKKLSFLEMDLFTSGILYIERSRYLNESLERGWKIQSEIEKEGWCGFHFKYTPS